MEKRMVLLGVTFFLGMALRRLMVGDVLTAAIIVLVLLALAGLYALLWNYVRRLLVSAG